MMFKLFLKLYLHIVIGFIFLQIVLGMTLNHALEDKTSRDVLSTSRGVNSLIREVFFRHPQSEWPKVLSSLQKQFDYPLTLLDANSILIDDKHRTGLVKDGEFASVKVPLFGKASVNIYILLNEDKILQQQVSASTTNSLLLSFLPIFLWLSVLATIIFAFIFPLQRRLQKLSSIALRVSKGDFDVNFQPFAKKETADLAAAFSTLIHRIKGLLSTQSLFLRLVAHEFRTPLTRLHFAIEELRNDTNQIQLNSINSDLEELNSMISDLRKYVGLSNDEYQKPSITEFSLKSDLDDQISIFAQGNINLDIQTQWKGSDVIVSDRKLVAYCIKNILSNAAKFTHSKILVSVDNTKEFTSVCIEDDGHGVPVKDIPELTIPFKKHNRKGGLGLGLSMVSTISVMLDGNLSFSKSSLGGLSVTLTLPKKFGL